MKAPVEQPYDLQEVRAALTKGGLVKRDADLSLEAYPPAFSRHFESRRWHFRVAAQEQTICHLIVGFDLARVHARAEGIFNACPDLICRPLLFWERKDKMGFLCLEHSAGESLDDLVKNGRCTPSQWVALVRQAQTLLAGTSQPSTAAALEREVHALLEDACTFPGISPLDAQLLRELAQPAILKEAISGPIASQWSNGDFTGRNLLVDEQGRIRLIDYEYAGLTHFGRTDWLRLKQFSALPPDLDESMIPEIQRAQTPGQETRFWLHQLAQLKSATISPEVAQHLTRAVSQLFAAIRQSAASMSGGRSQSLLIDWLTEHQKQTESALQERTAWAASLDGERIATHSALDKISREFEERTKWARSLEIELAQARSVLAERTALAEARTAWARTLDAELANARPVLAEQTALIAARTARAQSLETELARVRSALAEQTALVEKRTAWAQSLENELRSANEKFAKLAQDHEEGTQRAFTLRAEIAAHETRHAAPAAYAARAALIKFPSVPKPVVSIIIPVYNQLELTLTCLESLMKHAAATTFEVIIIDDNSAADVPETLAQVSGLRLMSNEVNQGFVLNCNRGAQEARGEYVLFLNNDTEVTSGWLEALVNVFAQRPNAGAVGAKLVYPDGRLQEAGGIVGEDGIGWNFGRGDDPARPEYNYLRQVDYCSGACLLIPRELFMQLGGFDTRYQPAYYEDTDLAFGLRAAGKEVYYQPAAQIIHVEGASSGTDLRQGVKKHQVTNHAKFVEKWAGVLPHYNAEPGMLEVARDRHASCNILVIDACALTPDMDAGSLRMFNLLKILAGQGCKVTFAAENLQVYEPFTSMLRQAGVEHLEAPAISYLEAYLELHAYAFDVVILSRKQVAQQYIDIVRRCAPAARIVFDTVDLIFLRLSRQAALEKSAELHQAAAASRLVELELCAKSDLVFVVSPEEARLLGGGVPAEKIAVVPLIHATIPSRESFAHRQGVLFVGGYQHPPNLDAIEYFLDKIYPLVKSKLPDLEVHVVGSNTPDRLRQRASDKVIIHGYVPDLDPILNRVRVSIAPLRFGAGVKGKVNQSMAHGVPVVATSIATEGMYLIDGENVLVGDTPETFAEAVFRIYTDGELWQKISAEGLKNIERYFSFGAVEKMLVSALGPGILSRRGLERPLARRPAALYALGSKILFGQAGNLKDYAREGWARPDPASCWITGGKASLVCQLPPGAKPRRVTVVVVPFLVPGALAQQRLRLIVDSRAVPGEMTVGEPREPKELVWDLDPAQPASSQMTLTFICPDATSPASLGLSADERRLSFAFLELTITSQAG